MRSFRIGEDIRYLQLTGRRLRLRTVVPKRGESTATTSKRRRSAFHTRTRTGPGGIVTKRKGDPYLPDRTKWLKIRNTGYSQWIGREELFERERATDPSWHYWNACASASDQLVEAPP